MVPLKEFAGVSVESIVDGQNSRQILYRVKNNLQRDEYDPVTLTGAVKEFM